MKTETVVKNVVYELEKSISEVKNYFSSRLAENLNLLKVEAPLIVEKGTGINDDLNGIENPVLVHAKAFPDKKLEIVHSLAKWKRYKLAELEVEPGEGIYTDMRALRPDEELSEIHSIYVDQWDWEKVISRDSRNLSYLKETVEIIYSSLKDTEKYVSQTIGIEPILPDKITFIHSEELLALYPHSSPKERENAITQEHGAVFLIGIGGVLANGEKHDGRAADYDDWSSKSSESTYGLNGDILVWNPVLEKSFELSSMGIRVDQEALIRQLEIENQTKRLELFWHKLLLDDKLPLSIGGGIGQSRLAMFLLRKNHIKHVQQSIWA
jgi:aspartate--ammonia ligase